VLLSCDRSARLGEPLAKKSPGIGEGVCRRLSAVIAKEGVSLSHVGVKNVLAASRLGHCHWD